MRPSGSTHSLTFMITTAKSLAHATPRIPGPAHLILLALLLIGCENSNVQLTQDSQTMGRTSPREETASGSVESTNATPRSSRQVVPASTDSNQPPPIHRQEVVNAGSEIVSQTPRISSEGVIHSVYEEDPECQSGSMAASFQDSVGGENAALMGAATSIQATDPTSATTDGALADSQGNSRSRPEATLNRESKPEDVCRVFLDTLSRGDSNAASRMLTDIAELETARADLQLESPGVAGSTYQIFAAEYATTEKQIAQVKCLLHQPGSMPVVQLTWMMRFQPNGWKISGMSIRLTDTGPTDLLSFENPQDLQRIQQSVEQ